MSKIFYTLDIDAQSELYYQRDEVLNVKRNPDKNFWAYDLTYADKRPQISAPTVIGHFLNLLEDRYELLNNIGIKSSDTTIWMIYKYNMEFHPEGTRRLGENGTVLCVSGYQTSS